MRAIREAIEAAGGAIPFSEFQRLALYGPEGFYMGDAAGTTECGATASMAVGATASDAVGATDGEPGGWAGRRQGGWAGRRQGGWVGRRQGGRAGQRQGSFVTSPEVGPLFGAVLARYLDDTWRTLGEPSPFVVVDAGAGPGTLARSVLAAQPACRESMHYVAVETSPAQRASHPAGVESSTDLPPGPFDGVVVANELLDNVPFRLCVFDGAWREAYVAADDGDQFAEVLSSPLDPVPAQLPPSPGHGCRAALHDQAVAWLEDARMSVGRGAVLVIDYVNATTASMVMRPWREWLRTYRDHVRGGHYLQQPGTQDITVEIALDQFPEPDSVRTQAQFLRRWGIDDLVAAGSAYWAANAGHPDLTAIVMRSRSVEAEALLDPAGLGAFLAVEWQSRA